MFRKVSIVKVFFCISAVLSNTRSMAQASNSANSLDGSSTTPEKTPSSYGMFNLQTHTPQAKDARQIFIENPEMLFIGIYDVRTEDITIMPALSRDLTMCFTGVITPRNKVISREEILSLTKKYSLYIPRNGYHYKYQVRLTAHEYMLARMGITLATPADTLMSLFFDHPYKSLYGFSVARKTDSVEVYRTSRSVNTAGKDFFASENIPLPLKDKIEKTFYEWLHSNENKNTSQCSLSR
jgi:hypothetical protein